jgi:phospholipase/lecithinase/hemolysin
MNPRYPLRKLFAALLIVCVLPSIASAQVPHFDSLYVFGDSLADNGNVLIQSTALNVKPPVPPSASPHQAYFNGRFSNGYVGFEYLWERLTGKSVAGPDGVKPSLASPLINGAGAVDFAYGGTGTALTDQTPGGMWAPGLKGQIELFRRALQEREPSDRALYAIVTGSNDYRVDPFNVPMPPADVVRNIEEGIISLYELGARHVMVLDMPDLGLIPASVGDPTASDVSDAHNKILYKRLHALQARMPELHLIIVKLGPLFHHLLKMKTLESHVPALEIFYPREPGMSACLFINPVLCKDVPPWAFNANLGFLFWDVVHPTTEAHRSLAEYLYEQLAASYE